MTFLKLPVIVQGSYHVNYSIISTTTQELGCGQHWNRVASSPGSTQLFNFNGRVWEIKSSLHRRCIDVVNCAWALTLACPHVMHSDVPCFTKIGQSRWYQVSVWLLFYTARKGPPTPVFKIYDVSHVTLSPRLSHFPRAALKSWGDEAGDRVFVKIKDEGFCVGWS